MTSIERRIEELEHKTGTGVPKYRILAVSFEKIGDEERAQAEAIARDEASNGPLQPNERYIFATFGPAGYWVETPEGLRWQYPDGTFADPDVWAAYYGRAGEKPQQSTLH